MKMEKSDCDLSINYFGGKYLKKCLVYIYALGSWNLILQFLGENWLPQENAIVNKKFELRSYYLYYIGHFLRLSIFLKFQSSFMFPNFIINMFLQSQLLKHLSSNCYSLVQKLVPIRFSLSKATNCNTTNMKPQSEFYLDLTYHTSIWLVIRKRPPRLGSPKLFLLIGNDYSSLATLTNC